MDSISCAAAGECAAGGNYTDGSGHGQPFVVSETNGNWGDSDRGARYGDAQDPRGGRRAGVTSISCAVAGECAAGGSYFGGSGPVQAFVVSETNGSWGDATEVPGTAMLNGATMFDLVCHGRRLRRRRLLHRQTRPQTSLRGRRDKRQLEQRARAVEVPRLLCRPERGRAGAPLLQSPMSAAANCSVGTITRVYSKAKYGRVLAQHPNPGKNPRRGAKVALTVSKGRRR